ncbi:MAG: hypothetical protein QFF03_12675 [Pseudomonadota bacterium]|nr:hypothetical protein [Pseudomonadota bacterium]
MQQAEKLFLRTVIGATIIIAALGAARAQTQAHNDSTDANVPVATAQKQAREIAQGDPARWFRENPSSAARLRNLQKEIGAGLQEAQGACRKVPAGERAGCLKEARATYQHDMAGARAQIMADPQG